MRQTIPEAKQTSASGTDVTYLLPRAAASRQAGLGACFAAMLQLQPLHAQAEAPSLESSGSYGS